MPTDLSVLYLCPPMKYVVNWALSSLKVLTELGVSRLNQILAAPFSVVGKALHMISSATPWRSPGDLEGPWPRHSYLYAACETCASGERVNGGSERGISAVDEVVKIAGHSSLESVHDHLYLLFYHLYLRDNRGWSRIHEGWDAYVLPLQSARGVTAFQPFAISSLNTRIL